MTEDQQQGSPVPGWYPDPLEQADLRWFDGAAWTQQTRAREPQPPAPSAPAPSAAEAQLASAASTEAERTAAGGFLPGSKAGRTRTAMVAAAAVIAAILIGYFMLGIGAGDSARDNDAAAPASEPAGEAPDASGGFVQGDLATPDDPQAAIDAGAQRAATDTVASIARAMQSCIAANGNGTVTGCTTTRLLEISPSLQTVLDGCGKPAGGCIKPLGKDGFEVRVKDTAAPARTWIEIHTSGGSITRTCEPAGCTPSGSWEPDDAGA